jgi:lipoprotein NlpD
MVLRNGILTICLSSVVLSGCSSAKAPVYTRGTAPEPRARIMQPPGATVPSRTTVPMHPTGSVYVVQRGDTLYSIAWQHGLKVDALARLNRLRPPYTIYPGQRLRVRPDAAPPSTPLAHAAPLARAPLPKPAPVPATRSQTRTAPAPAPAPAAAHMAETPPYDGHWQWPTRGRLLRSYQGNSNGKKGIDISGHHGQPVNAAAGGKVVYVGSGLVGYGRLIIIKHNESLLSAYGHNSKLLVAEGDQVRAGQLIAKMGSSGTSRTALYFEIRKDGKPVDPLRFLPRQ